MKHLFFTTVIALLSLNTIAAQGIDFFEGTWEEALEVAKVQEKLIFVDAYAVWCGPCKRMSKAVFPDKMVGEFYNRNFISMKIDMERGMGLEFRKKYPVSAFPTLFYIDHNGKVIQKIKGAQNVEGFIRLGKKALSSVDYSQNYEAEYEKGNRDPELVYNYVKALNRSGKSSLKVSNEYIRSQKDLNSEQNLKFILEAAIEADSRLFDLLIEKRKQIEAVTSAKDVQTRIYVACENTAKKAIEFESKDLLEEAKTKMSKHHPAQAKAFAAAMEMDFCLAMKNADHYTKACKEYAKTITDNKANELQRLAFKIVENFDDNSKAMKQAEAFAKEAAKAGNKYNYYLTYASILFQNGKKSQAEEAANKSLELARSNSPGAVKSVEAFIERLKQES